MSSETRHIALGDLYEFVRGTTSGMDADSQSHLEQCDRCQSDVSWLQRMFEFATSERDYRAPTHAIAVVEKLARSIKPRVKAALREVFAELIFDTVTASRPAGVRAGDEPARQALYRTGNVQLDLKIEPGEEKGLIIGQVVADNPDVVVKGLEIELTQDGELVGISTTNAMGEFIFQDLQDGNYEIQLALHDTMVKLPPFPLSKPNHLGGC